jgi:hypothetical protein
MTTESGMLPEPVLDIMTVFDSCLFAYAGFREAGSEPDDALRLALTALLPPSKCGPAHIHLYGHPWESDLTMKPEGRAYRLGILARGEETWANLRTTPGWSD